MLLQAKILSDHCPIPEEPCQTGAFIKPLIWSPCTSDAHLCATGCASLPYLLGKSVGHEMCGVITKVGSEVHDFKVGDKVVVCAVMPVWRSLEAQDGLGKQHQDNMYSGVNFPDRGGSFIEEYYIRDADMNLALIPDGVTLEQAVMVPDMMCTAFEGVEQLALEFGTSVAPEKLITHRYHGMEQIIDAMNLFLNHDRSLIKPVIYND